MSGVRAPRFHYQSLQVGSNVLFPVESTGLNEFGRFTGVVEVGRRRFCDEVAEVC